MLRRFTNLHLTPIRYASSAVNISPVLTPTRQASSYRTGSEREEEKAKILRRRIEKAERDERMDITMALTPVKEFMGGFTRPKIFRASNWFSGGHNEEKDRIYEEPSSYAYEPHTVFLLESRHHVRYGIGRVDHFEHHVGVCRTPDLEKVIQMYNSRFAPPDAIQAMDNARWPWQPQKKVLSVRWWDEKELREAQVDSSIPNSSPKVTVSEQDDLQDAWTRPGDSIKASEKDVERRGRQTDSVKHRVSEENLEDIVVELSSKYHKVPFEVVMDDGSVVHPSGFLPPTAADKFNDASMIGSNAPPHPATAPKRTAAIEGTHSESVSGVDQWEAIKAREMEEGYLMPHLTSEILSSGASADIKSRRAKIPTEIHGVHDGVEAQPTQHPSGFIPPTPKMSRGEYEARTAAVSGSSPLQSVRDLRTQYLPEIAREPFWRPLLTITVSTRPLACSLARLSRSLSRGLPYHASIDKTDRKSKTSFPLRLRNLRLERMQSLIVGLAQVLAGARGGLLGLRFSPSDRGRGIGGEGLDRPIPWEKRVIGVGIAEWYSLAEEVKQTFEEFAKSVPQPHNEGRSNPFLLYEVDEWGKPVDSKVVENFPWSKMVLDSPKLYEAQDALEKIKMLRRMLEEDEELGGGMKVFVPKPEVGEHHWPEFIDLDVPITVLGADDTLPADFDVDQHVVIQHHARALVKGRIDRLFGEYSEGITQLQAARGKGVTYPYWPTEPGESDESEDDEDFELDFEAQDAQNQN